MYSRYKLLPVYQQTFLRGMLGVSKNLDDDIGLLLGLFSNPIVDLYVAKIMNE